MAQKITGDLYSKEEILSDAKKAENIGDLDTAMKLYLSLAETGDAEGQYKYAEIKESLLQDDDNPSKSDLNQIFNLYKQSAEQGYAPAQCALGYLYEYGSDKSRALYWFQKSAEQGYPIAQYNVGYFYKNGISIPKDNDKAFYWFQKSAEQGYSPAQWVMGNYYAEGIVIPEDKNKALILYKKSAEQDFSPAQNTLGIYYAEGIVVPKNNSQALYWFQKSAEQDFGPAQSNLGRFYLESDEEKAFYWLHKAGNNYCDDEDSDGNELCEIANMYNYLLTPEDWRDKIIQTKNNGRIQKATGISMALIGLFVSAPLVIGGILLSSYGSFNSGKAYGSIDSYKNILQSTRGQEMIYFYEEAKKRGSQEAHEYLNNLHDFLKKFKIE
ncbi:tetratricopeptide repeat protein [Oribacterium sp. WCC10]|uniref:tetratricopeptide repeat protein n=1 Tax=Oribacterium sp. WCC10 TaxID=1855343 RepID=UPI0008F08C1E|nr:tetratricopeptide repeat protein [Oribacterium sp. WCC10]SFG56179.1 TPR repeat [Oribacterium sp. WCC10]